MALDIDKPFSEILREIIVTGNLSQTKIANKTGTSQGTVSKWLKGEQDPLWQQAKSVLKLHEATTGGDVPVVGFAGAGGEMDFSHGQGPFGHVDRPAGAAGKIVAVEIRGDSLGPFFNGWFAFYRSVETPPTDDLIGTVCVVGLPDGRVLIKKLIRGSRPGAFTLLSQNGSPEENVDLDWAAKVLDMAPRVAH